MPFGLVSAWNKRRRSKSHDHSDPWLYKPVEYWQLEDQTPRPPKRHHGSSVFTFREMEEATRSFSDGNFLGKGGFGRVYRGILRSGEIVAIKKMELPAFKEAEGEREFRVEVDILSRLDHQNLVSLIGYCADGKDRFLVYEYMKNGNLQDRLNGIGDAKMYWPLRLKVALGAAKGLAYLHSGCDVGIPIVHRDFKSTNILLDTNFEAKISDFGLAKLMPEGQETYVTARVLGTFGYFDPEYTSTGKLTLQSDVYAFGVVLLELLTGRRAVDLDHGPNDQNLVLQNTTGLFLYNGYRWHSSACRFNLLLHNEPGRIHHNVLDYFLIEAYSNIRNSSNHVNSSLELVKSDSKGLFTTGSILHIKCLRLCNINKIKRLSVFTMRYPAFVYILNGASSIILQCKNTSLEELI